MRFHASSDLNLGPARIAALRPPRVGRRGVVLRAAKTGHPVPLAPQTGHPDTQQLEPDAAPGPTKLAVNH